MTDATLGTIAIVPDELESPSRRALRRLFKRKGAVVGLVVVATFALLALLAPLVVPYDPIATSWSLVRKPPSALHWFGTDELGRDILARVIYGARASLLAGAISVGIALSIGVPLGLLSGYRGGFIDALISRITDAMLACPFLILAIALAAFLGPSLGNAMIAIGISATPIFIRLTRGQVMSVKVEDYVEAARAMGNPRWRIALFVLLSLFAPLIVPYDPIATSWSLVRKPPTLQHWFGTDDLGRDILTRVIYGARASLTAGAISVGIALAIGVPFGLLAGYGGRWIDAVISRITDAMLAIPFLILAIALAAFLGPSLQNAMIAIGVTATPIFVRLTRGQVMSVKVEDYVEAARAVGNPPVRIAVKHILPNIMPSLIVQATISIATAIIAEASLSFLGLGQQPPAPSWGSMLNTAQRFLTNAPWMAVWPGLAIFLAVLSFNILGDGLRDALDPKER